MRVNGFLSRVSGMTKIKLYEKVGDTVCEYVQSMSVNEYFEECYDRSFADYDIKSVSVQDNTLCIWICKADPTALADAVESIHEHIEDLSEALNSFKENYL